MLKRRNGIERISPYPKGVHKEQQKKAYFIVGRTFSGFE
jgi:hypothetical protein